MAELSSHRPPESEPPDSLTHANGALARVLREGSSPQAWEDFFDALLAGHRNNEFKPWQVLTAPTGVFNKYSGYDRFGLKEIDPIDLLHPSEGAAIARIDAAIRDAEAHFEAMHLSPSSTRYEMLALTCGNPHGTTNFVEGAIPVLTSHDGPHSEAEVRGVFHDGRLYLAPHRDNPLPPGSALSDLFSELITLRNSRSIRAVLSSSALDGYAQLSVQQEIHRLHQRTILVGLLLGLSPLETNWEIMKDLDARDETVRVLTREVGERNLAFAAYRCQDEFVIRFPTTSWHTNMYYRDDARRADEESQEANARAIRGAVDRIFGGADWRAEVSIQDEDFDVSHKWEAQHFYALVIRGPLALARKIWGALREVGELMADVHRE